MHDVGVLMTCKTQSRLWHANRRQVERPPRVVVHAWLVQVERSRQAEARIKAEREQQRQKEEEEERRRREQARAHKSFYHPLAWHGAVHALQGLCLHAAGCTSTHARQLAWVRAAGKLQPA